MDGGTSRKLLMDMCAYVLLSGLHDNVQLPARVHCDGSQRIPRHFSRIMMHGAGPVVFKRASELQRQKHRSRQSDIVEATHIQLLSSGKRPCVIQGQVLVIQKVVIQRLR